MTIVKELQGHGAKVWKLKFEELLGTKPEFEEKEPSPGKYQCRVINAHISSFGEERRSLGGAQIEALRMVFEGLQVTSPADPVAAAQRAEPTPAAATAEPVRSHLSGESDGSGPMPGEQIPSDRIGHQLLYRKNGASQVPAEVLDLVDAFEQAPSARGAMNVLEVYKANVPDDLKNSWETEKRKLQDRNLNPNFPKPEWQDRRPSKDDIDERTKECLRREREEVAWQLLSVSHKHEGGARSCRVYHGCPTWEVVESICRTGFAGNVQKTRGWFGEGLYSTLHAPYALRYGLGMRDFWEKPGEEGWVIAAKLVYLQVYPVTEADNSTPLEPGLKGKRIGDADGACGCDCQFVCVRGHPPFGKHQNRTYHACKHGERPEATEIVVNQEAQILPEYLIKVQVGGGR